VRSALRYRLGFAAVVFTLIVAGFGLETLYVAGAFKTITPHFAGSCRKILGVVGAESMLTAADGRHVLISADDRRSALAKHPVPGGLWSYDPEEDAPPRNLTPDATDSFHPHGIGFWPADEGAGGRLFVINHPDEGRVAPGGGRQTIEIYDWQEDGLIHRRTLTDPLLVSPNAIVAAGPDSFYVTNDHAYRGLMRTLEDWLRLAASTVVYAEQGRFSPAAAGISFANGVALSPDGKHLYVASTLGRELLIFDRDPAQGALANRRTLALGTSPDNITRLADGTLLIGAHPQILKTLAAASDAETLAPSQVLDMRPRADGSYDVNEIFVDGGEALSASSGATLVGKHLLVATAFDDHFLDCLITDLAPLP
jgi:arylesterase / paraoxonase